MSGLSNGVNEIPVLCLVSETPIEKYNHGGDKIELHVISSMLRNKVAIAGDLCHLISSHAR